MLGIEKGKRVWEKKAQKKHMARGSSTRGEKKLIEKKTRIISQIQGRDGKKWGEKIAPKRRGERVCCSKRGEEDKKIHK